VALDERNYPLPRILATAERASDLRPDAVPDLLKALDDPDSAVRYWAAMGFLMRGSNAVHTARTRLLPALVDAAPSVRVAAAEALAHHGNPDDLKAALPVLLDHANVSSHGLYLAVTALNAIDDLDHKAASERDAIQSLPRKHPSIPPRLGDYIGRLLEKILADLASPNPATATSP
jgi:uncharacterized sulfatase